MFKYPQQNFIGNKNKIAHWICENIPKDVYTFFDAFSGGGAISYAAKQKGLSVISNDIMLINYYIAQSLIENNGEFLTSDDIELIFKGLPQHGFMYENYSNRYYFPDECAELDLYTQNIQKFLSPIKKALAYTILRRAMIRKMPYSRFTIQWKQIVQLRDEDYSYEKYKRKRAYHNISFMDHFMNELPNYNNAIFSSNIPCKAYNEDVFDLIDKIDADLIYLDPPYTGTMNNYFGFYGVIDEMIQNKKLEPFKHNFIDKKIALQLFDKLFSKLKKYKYWMLSYNNSSYPTKEQLLELLTKYCKKVNVLEHEHVYKITGKTNKKKNIEYLFIAEV